MAQTGYTPLLIYSSSTVSQAPSAGNLTNSTLGSELAINITDGKLFYKDNANAVQVIAWKTTPTTAGGTGLTSYTAGDLLYYATGTTLSKLAIGSAYQALQVNAGGTAPSWQASATSTLTAQGDLLYASAANTLARLAKNTTATRYLSNTGSSNNPAWAQVDLSNGVTGTLPVGNGGTGQTSWNLNGVLYASGTTTLATTTTFAFDGNNLAIGAAANANNRLLVQKTDNTVYTSGARGYLWQQIYNPSTTSGAYVGLEFAVDGVGNASLATMAAIDAGSGTTEFAISTRVSNTFADALYIDSSRNIKFVSGNLVQGTAAKGVNFTANTPAAGMTSQLLNWYEEGTWTPVPTASTGTITSYTSSGRYTRIGRSVVLSFQITITNNGTGAGILFATGMPFAANAVNLESGTIAEVAIVGFSGYTVFNTTTKLSMGKYDNTYPGGTNYVIVGQITYQI